MKVAFVVRLLSNYRLFGPVIDRALACGLDVECWHDFSFTRSGVKKYLFPGTMPAFQHGQPLLRSYEGPADLARRLEQLDVDVVVSLTPPQMDTEGASYSRRPAWVVLQSGNDTFHWRSDFLADCDVLALHSPWWLEWGAAHRGTVEQRAEVAELQARLAERARYVGYPEAESVALADRAAIRQRWGIPAGQPVVVVLPFPQGVGRSSFWPRKIFGEPSRLRRLFNVVAHREFGYLGAAWGGSNDVDLTRAIRQFSDRNGAFLLVKSREKTPIPEYLRNAADRCIYDEGFYPPTIVEALSIASLCISHYSLGILEATALGVPHVCVAFRAEDYLGLRALPKTNDFYSFFNREDGGLFEFGGVARTASAAEAIGAFERGTFDDFRIAAAAQRAYQAKFFGDVDGRSAHRVVDAIQDIARERAHAAAR